MFRAASVMLLNKIDLLPHLDFDVDAAIGFARRVNPQIRIMALSATSGEGMGEWLQFLRDGLASAVAAKRDTADNLQRRGAQQRARSAVAPAFEPPDRAPSTSPG
jgi:hydrogenase nickel incorporation protein HypB